MLQLNVRRDPDTTSVLQTLSSTMYFNVILKFHDYSSSFTKVQAYKMKKKTKHRQADRLLV